MRKSVVEMKDGLAKNAGAINCLTQEKNKPAIAQTTAGSSSKETEELLLAALLAAGVHSGLEGGARNELRHLSGRNRDGGAGGGIAAGAGRTILKLERTEADERQRLAALDGSHHFIDHRAKNAVGFCLGNGVLFGNLFDKIHAIHRLSPYLFVQCAASPKEKVARQRNRIFRTRHDLYTPVHRHLTSHHLYALGLNQKRRLVWWGHLDLNQGPIGYEPTALTTELCPHRTNRRPTHYIKFTL